MDRVLEIVGLAPYKKERCGKFSLGMKQRMGLALALLSQPELMILDEPTNGLDIEATVEVREIILRLAKEKGVTFLVASHLASEIEKMCDKVLVLHEGEMLSFDTKEEAPPWRTIFWPRCGTRRAPSSCEPGAGPWDRPVFG